MSKLSIIIPVYNTEQYLQECLDSICEQNFEDIQIICVNDCSTDNSFNILQQYKEHCNFVEVHCNSGNRGLSYARNKGMKYANGEYIMFVDSDDYIAHNILHELFYEIKHKDADVMLFDVQEVGNNVYDKDKRIRKQLYADARGIQFFSDLVKHDEMFAGAWSGIYKREFLEQINLRFIEGILHEDIPFMFAALLKAQRVVYFPKVTYYYRQRENSILHKPDYEKLSLGLLTGVADMIITWQQCKTQNENADKYDIYVGKYIKSVIRLLNSRCASLRKEKQEISEGILKAFADNFDIHIKTDLSDYFSLEKVEIMKRQECVSLYGAGETAISIIPLLQDAGIRIDKIYVTNPDRNQDFLLGIPIMRFERIPFYDKQHCIVIAAVNKNKEEIMEQLSRNRYCGCIITI